MTLKVISNLSSILGLYYSYIKQRMQHRNIKQLYTSTHVKWHVQETKKPKAVTLKWDFLLKTRYQNRFKFNKVSLQCTDGRLADAISGRHSPEPTFHTSHYSLAALDLASARPVASLS